MTARTDSHRRTRSAWRFDPEALLAQVSFFADMPRDVRRTLAEVVLARELSRGECLFRQGQRGRSMYVLLNGRLRLSRSSPEGGAQVLKVVRPGEIFAEVVLFERDDYPADAVAIEPSRVLEIRREDLRRCLDRAEFRDAWIAMLLRRLHELASRIPSRLAPRVEDRLLFFLNEQFGDAPRVETSLTRRDVAAAIGVTPEALSRVLARLRRQGRMRWEGRILERPELAAPPRSQSHGGAT